MPAPRPAPVLSAPGPPGLSRRAYFPQLDRLRGIAALLVVLGHFRNLFFADYAAVQRPSTALSLFYLATRFQREAVLVFFVLSGCVIANVVASAAERGPWSFWGYIRDRLVRLWVVLLPALVLGGFLDLLGSSRAASRPIYTQPEFAHVLAQAWRQVTVPIAFGNAVFLQGIAVPTFGSNGPLWSLSYEFWYYVLFALGFGVVSRGRRTGGSRACFAAAGLVVLALVGPAIRNYFLIWLFGVGAFYLNRRVPSALVFRGSLTRGISWVFPVALAIYFLKARVPGAFLSDFILSFFIALAVYSSLGVSTPSAPRASSASAVPGALRPGLAAASYSLYLLHLPFLVFVAAHCFRSDADRWQPGAAAFCRGAVVLGALGVYVFAVYFLTERRTAFARDWARRIFPWGGVQAPDKIRSAS